ncbi:MAG: methyltransferase domain-containing protein [Burkholderiales bacterium]
MIDMPAVRRFANRAARRAADAGDAVAREVESRMIERLALMRLSPARILDAGCGRYPAFSPLRAKYPNAEVIALDFARDTLAASRGQRGWVERVRHALGVSHRCLVCADMATVPLPGGSLGLVWSNLSLGSQSDLKRVFDEWHRVLEVGGLVMFTAYGPDTLKELRASFAAAGQPAAVHAFVDMHDLGDMLVGAGFADPVMDMELLTLTYTSVAQLLAEIRDTGQSNALLERRRGLLGKKRWQAVLAAYEAERRDGRIPASIEIVYGHAWKGAPKKSRDGSSVMHFLPVGQRARGVAVKRVLAEDGGVRVHRRSSTGCLLRSNSSMSLIPDS